MKYKWFTKYALLSLLGVSVLGGSYSTLASAGVDSSGGGNLLPPEPVTLEQLEQGFRELQENWQVREDIYSFFADLQAQVVKQAYIDALQTSTEDSNYWKDPSFIDRGLKLQDPKKLALIEKLFPQTRDVMSVLKRTEFYLEKNGPCFDGAGAPKDANAYPFESPRICFSGPLILEQLNDEGLHAQIMALAVHELSHKLGANDPEADRLQQEFFDPRPAYYSSLRGLDKFGGVVAEMTRDLEEIEKVIKAKASLVKICSKLAKVDANLTVALDKDRFGLPNIAAISGVRIQHQMEAATIWAKVFLLRTACQSEDDSERQRIVEPFGEATRMPLRRYLHKLSGNNFPMPYIPMLTQFGETVSPLAYGDLAAMLEEVSGLTQRSKALLEQINMEIRKEN